VSSLVIYSGNGNDLWVFFADNSSEIGGPFLYCFGGKSLRLKESVRLFSDRGRPVTSPYDPLFVARDQQGNFILATELGYLTKVDRQGNKIYRRRLMGYDCRWTTRWKPRKKPYFVRDIDRQGDHCRKSGDYFGKAAGSLHMLGAAYSKSSDLVFIGQGCQCCNNDVIVYSGDGKYLRHFEAPAGPSAMVARDGLLYLADHYFCFIHVYTYEGRWLRSIDALGRNRQEGLFYLTDGCPGRKMDYDEKYATADENCIVSMCSLGEDKLAIGMEGGLVRIIDGDGRLLFDIEPPRPGLYPNSMTGDSQENLFVYYTGDAHYRKPAGLYCYDAKGEIRGPYFRGELGLFSPMERELKKRIANGQADACDYFQLPDIQIRREKLTHETILLLEKSVELKPDLWIALAYLGIYLKALGETEQAVICMEKAMAHMDCSVMATALVEYYYRLGDREKVWHYFQRMEEGEGEVHIDFYSEELTNEHLEAFLGPLVKRNRNDYLISNKTLNKGGYRNDGRKKEVV